MHHSLFFVYYSVLLLLKTVLFQFTSFLASALSILFPHPTAERVRTSGCVGAYLLARVNPLQLCCIFVLNTVYTSETVISVQKNSKYLTV